MMLRAVQILLFAWSAATFALQSTTAPEPLVYRNSAHDFCLTLPASWSGYSIVTEQWKGQWVADEPRAASVPDLAGPKILIRHPKWTSSAPREDIPIMIFSVAQWKLIEAEKVSVSAAPVGPAELGRNAKYVFALPPRYAFDEKEGVEEVIDVVNNHPLRAPRRSVTVDDQARGISHMIPRMFSKGSLRKTIHSS